MALVISRKPGESFTIGPDIKIEVGEWARGQIRLLITAPKTVPVCRDNMAARPDGLAEAPAPG
jgi:carbon storage regulator CsrA